MGKRIAAVIASLLVLGVATSSPVYATKVYKTKIINLNEGSPGGTRTVTGDVSSSAKKCIALRVVNLYINDTYADGSFADSVGHFSLSASDATGTWSVRVYKQTTEHHRWVCRPAEKHFTV